MPVYQPNAVVGNSRILVSLGANAEMMSFFYPHVDFSQNLQEGMPAVYFSSEGSRSGELVWTFDPSWESRQRYAGRSNIVETDLKHAPTGLSLRITDLVHPSEPVFLRHFQAANTSDRRLRAKLFQYLDLQLGEVEQKNAVHFHPERHVAVAYWRNICFAIGSPALDEYGCGRSSPGSSNSAKRQMEQGGLNRQSEEIGDIDLAVGWALDLAPGQRVARELIIAADSNELAAVERLNGARELGWEALLQWARNRWEEHLAQARPLQIEPDLDEAYHRCLLAIDLLADPDTGSILAAPEFDPFFERSGGYGYCWPRDAVEVCLALQAAGYPGYLSRFLSWARRTQRPEGYWEQRYWLSGQRGPAWCSKEDALQIDQTASVLFAMGRCYRALEGQAQVSFLEEFWGCINRAATYLVDAIRPEHGLHAPGFDLWETFRGTFTYSNAAIAAALREAGPLAGHAGQDQLAQKWEAAAAAIKTAVMSRLRQGEMFARGLDLENRLDGSADAAALGLIVPFEFLRLDDAGERQVASAAVEGLVKRLAQPSDGAELLLRFEGDT
ncbi:MAG: glycoside hydrolase family 15 protein, partial [Armatimonadota bacterium]|nr:glycoside hydrolase family 15 protein [Armatimonadota bacterium]